MLPAPFPPSVDVYHELSLKRTIIEVQAGDEPGLLYRLARLIFKKGFDITFARIATERGVAMDTFYIEKANAKEPRPRRAGRTARSTRQHRQTRAHRLVQFPLMRRILALPQNQDMW